jgi:hypothetical protein
MGLRGSGARGRWTRPWAWVLPLAVGVSLAFAGSASASGDSIAISPPSPAHPSGTTSLTITVTGTASSGNDLVLAAVVPEAGGCPTQYANPPGGYWIDAPVSSSGSFEPVSSIPRHLEHGSYDICAWLVEQTQPTATVAATATPVPLTVSNPDSLSVSVTPAALVDGASANVSVSGVADVEDPEVYVTEKPASEGGCAAAPSLDRGTPLADYDPAFVNYDGFSDSQTEYPGNGKSGPDALPPGRYTLCGWLIDADGSTTQPLAPAAETTVTLLPPAGTLAFSVPELVQAGSRFSVAADLSTAAADVGVYLDLKPLPARGPTCAASQSLEPRAAQLVIDDGHATSATASAKVRSAGVYIACAWLEWPHGTIDGPFSGRFVALGRHQRPVEYSGGTSQRLRHAGIVLQAVDGQVVNLTYHARFACSKRGHKTSYPVYSTTFPAFGLSKGGAFADTFIQGNDHAKVTGRLRGRSTHGTFSEAYTSGGYACRSGTVSFTARRGRGSALDAAVARGATRRRGFPAGAR